MSNVQVPFGDNPGETATLLLAAAEDLDMSQRVVKTTTDSTFVVPSEVADQAGLDYEGKSKPAKKAAAKKSSK